MSAGCAAENESTMTAVYHENDGDLSTLAGATVAVIGYGNIGRSMALNLRDSGVRLVVSDPTAQRATLANEEGFSTDAIDAAVATADIVLLLVRDEAMPRIYIEHVAPHLRRDHTLIFSSAYTITHKFIEPPPFVDVGLVAARTYGAAIRERFVDGSGFASFVAVEQDASQRAWDRVLAIARAVGALRMGAIEVRFDQETHLDLFMQQAVLPIFYRVLIAAARMLIDAGYPPEAVFAELYASGETADYFKQAAAHGLLATLNGQSLTAQYGVLTRYERLSTLPIERVLEQSLDDIRSETFAGEWAREFAEDYPRLRQLLHQRAQDDLWD